MKCKKSGNHTISYQPLLLSTTVLNDSEYYHDNRSALLSQLIKCKTTIRVRRYYHIVHFWGESTDRFGAKYLAVCQVY